MDYLRIKSATKGVNKCIDNLSKADKLTESNAELTQYFSFASYRFINRCCFLLSFKR